MRVESRGALMGFNEFCASAQNSKKRPRQTIHLSGTGLSLKQVCESGAWRGRTGGSRGCMRMPRETPRAGAVPGIYSPSLKTHAWQTTDEILGLTTQALGHDSSSSDEEGRQRPGSTTESSGRAGGHDSKRPKTSNSSPGGAAFAGDLELLKSSHD